MAHSGQEYKMLGTFSAAVCVFLCLNVRTVDADAVSWNYKPGDFGGPESWYIQFPECGGRMQSPVDINISEILFDPNLELFDFADYSITANVTMVLENVGGHTAEVTYFGEPVYLRGGGLPDDFELIQFHFHWGQNDSRGSEHTFNGHHYPMELHIVHKQRHLANMTVAAPHPSGLAVVGFFFTIGKENTKYNQMLNYFKFITNANSNVTIPTFAVKDLLPDSKRYDYFRYQGSLTTPPCYESVIWSIGVDPIEISEEQVNKFRGLFDEEHHQLVDDFRPIQNINQRSVLTTHPMYSSRSQCGDTGSVILPQISTFVLATLCLVICLF